jgi:serine/threonine protein kinase
MEYLHLKRIVHFDLKTGNLLVGFREKSPTCKVADFGLSKERQQTYVTGGWVGLDEWGAARRMPSGSLHAAVAAPRALVPALESSLSPRQDWPVALASLVSFAFLRFVRHATFIRKP